MKKYEFLIELKEKLSALPSEDVKKILDYYSEAIDDRMEEGISEEEAVKAIGSVDKIADEILKDISLPKLVKAKVKPRRALRIWEIIIIILGLPLWLPLIISFAVVIFSVYIVFWSVVVVMFAAVLSVALGAVAGVAGLIVFGITGNLAQAILFAGLGLICAGLTVFVYYAAKWVAKGVIFLGRSIVLGIKRCILGKGAQK